MLQVLGASRICADECATTNQAQVFITGPALRIAAHSRIADAEPTSDQRGKHLGLARLRQHDTARSALSRCLPPGSAEQGDQRVRRRVLSVPV
jgi:hypothetical protein